MSERVSTPTELVKRITNYLSNGGLFNPEHMEHHKVRDLLIDCRSALSLLRETPQPSTADEEMMPHVFRSRTPYEPGDDRDIWCRDCEYHRDHAVHVGETPAPPRWQQEPQPRGCYKDDEGDYVVCLAPELPGFITHGSSPADVLRHVAEIVPAWLEALAGEPQPPQVTVEQAVKKFTDRYIGIVLNPQEQADVDALILAVQQSRPGAQTGRTE